MILRLGCTDKNAFALLWSTITAIFKLLFGTIIKGLLYERHEVTGQKGKGR